MTESCIWCWLIKATLFGCSALNAPLARHGVDSAALFYSCNVMTDIKGTANKHIYFGST